MTVESHLRLFAAAAMAQKTSDTSVTMESNPGGYGQFRVRRHPFLNRNARLLLETGGHRRVQGHAFDQTGISSLRSPSRFLVELGAPIMVASTIVPLAILIPVVVDRRQQHFAQFVALPQMPELAHEFPNLPLETATQRR